MSAKTKKTKATDKSTLFVQGVPPNVKADFKSACAKRKQSMRDAIVELMQSFSKAAA